MNRGDQDYQTEQRDVKIAYGENAIATQVGKIRIVHLDNPTQQIIKERIEQVIADEVSGEAFDDCCPLCQEIKNESYDVVYDGFHLGDL